MTSTGFPQRHYGLGAGRGLGVSPTLRQYYKIITYAIVSVMATEPPSAAAAAQGGLQQG